MATGDVYQVLFMDFQGKFRSMDFIQQKEKFDNKNRNKKFLINIISEEVFVNDRPFKIIYIKDVTFGLLYESVKASENLKNMINSLINNKISEPLETLIRTCNIITAQNDGFTPNQSKAQNLKLKQDIQHMSLQSRYIIHSINDMKDY